MLAQQRTCDYVGAEAQVGRLLGKGLCGRHEAGRHEAAEAWLRGDRLCAGPGRGRARAARLDGPQREQEGQQQRDEAVAAQHAAQVLPGRQPRAPIVKRK